MKKKIKIIFIIIIAKKNYLHHIWFYIKVTKGDVIYAKLLFLFLLSKIKIGIQIISIIFYDWN